MVPSIKIDKTSLSLIQETRRYASVIAVARKNGSKSPSLCLHRKCLGRTRICEHGRHSCVCKQCRVLRCEHGKPRGPGRCKQCCSKHGVRLSRCAPCGGGWSLCTHGKQPSRCVPCMGSEICPHRILRRVCKTCHGSSICHHGQMRSSCRVCYAGGTICGGSICLHERQRSKCPECRLSAGLVVREQEARNHNHGASSHDGASSSGLGLGLGFGARISKDQIPKPSIALMQSDDWLRDFRIPKISKKSEATPCRSRFVGSHRPRPMQLEE